MKNSRYVVITPARNEEKYIEKTLTSMVGQTVLPSLWVIVDDGSSDGTVDVVEKYLNEHKWIKLIRRENRGFRKQGGGVIDTFYEGYQFVVGLEWDFIVKLDADVSFDKDYFQRVFKHFEKEPDLGISGGLILSSDGFTTWVESEDPDFHVRGATKIYRRKCWEDIGELVKAPGWDSLDELKANMKGWKTRTLRNIPIVHHRPTGSADGAWKNWYKNGMANYVTGYHPLFQLAKCIKRLFRKPFFIASLGLMWGYISGYLKNIERVKDTELIAYIRKQQLRRMIFRNSIWGR